MSYRAYSRSGRPKNGCSSVISIWTAIWNFWVFFLGGSWIIRIFELSKFRWVAWLCPSPHLVVYMTFRVVPSSCATRCWLCSWTGPGRRKWSPKLISLGICCWRMKVSFLERQSCARSLELHTLACFSLRKHLLLKMPNTQQPLVVIKSYMRLTSQLNVARSSEVSSWSGPFDQNVTHFSLTS